MKPHFSVIVASLVLGLSICSTSFASDKDDSINQEAEAKLASLSGQVSGDANVKDKDKALKKLISDYVKAEKKAYKKVEKDEANLEKAQNKLERDAKDLERRAEDMGPMIVSAKVSEDKANHDVEVADLVEHKFKQGEAGKAN